MAEGDNAVDQPSSRSSSRASGARSKATARVVSAPETRSNDTGASSTARARSTRSGDDRPNWPLFAATFGSLDVLSETLEQIRPIRHDASHPRGVGPEDLLVLAANGKRLLRWIGPA